VAPTILQILGLDQQKLDAVRPEGTPVLPAVQFGDDQRYFAPNRNSWQEAAINMWKRASRRGARLFCAARIDARW
jgi:hypothetical protein